MRQLAGAAHDSRRTHRRLEVSNFSTCKYSSHLVLFQHLAGSILLWYMKMSFKVSVVKFSDPAGATERRKQISMADVQM